MIITKTSKSLSLFWFLTVPVRSAALPAVALLIFGVVLPVAAQQIVDDYGYSFSEHQVSDLWFSDASRGWMVVQDRLLHESWLLKTDDGGKNWISLKAPEGITRIYFLDANFGWALKSIEAPDGGAYPSYLLRTSDGGKTWASTAAYQDSRAEEVSELAFINEKLGWVLSSGSDGSCLILETVDGGKTVHEFPRPVDSAASCRAIFASTKAGVWIYGSGSVLRSNNDGKTWERPMDLRHLDLDQGLFDMLASTFLSTGSGWFVGQNGDADGIILGTEDFGKRWDVSLRTEQIGNFSAVSFWDERHGCAVSFYPVLLFCTEDAGKSWKSRDVLPAAIEDQAKFFTRLVMLSSGRGWALRAGGYLYATSDGGQSWREIDALALPASSPPK
jgi:photosystem II stability/assembly factor-like uncharacterized protein